jgi:hypothetical protein
MNMSVDSKNGFAIRSPFFTGSQGLMISEGDHQALSSQGVKLDALAGL